MTPTDYQEFHHAWISAHAMSSSNQTPSDSTAMAVFDVLIEYPIQHVLGALQVHAKKSRFAPTPADICEIIDGRTKAKHIGSDEAWGLVLESLDEESTVIVTQEILEARGLVMDIYQSGDVIGARMAFRDAYSRIVSASNSKPSWFISAGQDGARRADAINKAVQLGRLPKLSGGEYLLGRDKPTATVAGLIESANAKAQNSDDANFRKTALRNIGALKAMLTMNEDDGVERREKVREAFELHRQNELKRLAERQGAVN